MSHDKLQGYGITLYCALKLVNYEYKKKGLGLCQENSLKWKYITENHTYVKKMGHTSLFLFGIYWRTWKTTIKETVKRVNTKFKNFNIYNDLFFFKKRKRLGDIIILHLCTKHLDDMIYSFWDETDWNWWLWVIFCPFTTLKTTTKKKQQNFEQMKKIAGGIILHTYTKNLLPHYWPCKLKFGKNLQKP